MRLRVFHHVIHFNPAKIANASDHMKSQAGMESRNQMASPGNRTNGKQTNRDASLVKPVGAACDLDSTVQSRLPNFPFGARNTSSMRHSNTLAILKASGRLGSYFSVSIALTV